MIESLSRLTLTPPPTPLPPQWARAIANSLTQRLRDEHGWIPNRASRAIGNARTGKDYRTANIPTPHPTIEVLWNQPYTFGVVDPIPALGVPMLAWHVLYYDAASKMQASRPDVDLFLRMKPERGCQPLPFRVAPNRHEQPTIRRNSDYAPQSVATALEAVATIADVWELDRHEVYDYLSQWDVIDSSITLALLDKYA